MLKYLQMKNLFENVQTQKNKRKKPLKQSDICPSTTVLNAIINYSKSVEVHKINEKKVVFCLN